MKSEVNPPNGFPYRLYSNSKGDKLIGLAVSEQQLYSKYQIHKKTKIKPVNVTQLISKHGHSTVNKLLKQFGQQWCTKAGHVFYKPQQKAA